jgi:CubicO group peptidase (beta-lactamase class C family)
MARGAYGRFPFHAFVGYTHFMLTRTAAAIACSFILTIVLLAADAPRIDSVSQRMLEFVDKKEVAGAVTLVVAPDRIVHLDATGKADIAGDVPMREDHIFWIASMTKPLTGVCVMMLQDEGKLSVEDPISKYIPELKDLKTKDGKSHVVAIRHILTHTAGLGEASREQERPATKLADLIPHYAAKPLAFEPGSKWAYSQSSINTAARIVEVVSGKSFDQFLQERLCGPLGMKDTTFYLSPEQAKRLAKSYRLTNGSLEESQIMLLNGHEPTSRQRYPAANGGLFATARDYGRFCQMLLNGGTLDGKQYLKPESVKYVSSVLSGDVKTGFTEGNGWGLGVCVVRQPQGVTEMLSPGTYGHGGAYGTQAWIDPQKKLAFILMVQRANFPNADNSDVRKAFQAAVVQALSK